MSAGIFYIIMLVTINTLLVLDAGCKMNMDSLGGCPG